MKKITAFILAVSILLSFFISVSAVEKIKSEKSLSDSQWQYTLLSENTAEITKYLGDSKKVEIPEFVNGYTVTSIGAAAFYNSEIEQISLPDSIDKIGWWSFYNCKNLNSVSLNNGLQTIEYGAFMNCNQLSSVFVPSTVNKIGEDAFAVLCTTTKNYKDIYSQKYISRQNYKTDNSFILSGYSGTFSEKYADDNNLIFESISTVSFADVDANGSAEKADAILLKSYLKNKTTLSAEQVMNADVDSDGSITSFDLQLIEKYINSKISYYDFPATANLKPSYNYLDGMSMYCDGDSIAKGTGTNILGNNFYSYCHYISEEYNVEMVNKAVAGTTLAKQKNKTKDENKSILERVKDMSGDYDLILLNGGFNDLFQNIKIGEVTDESNKSGKYDEYTTAGALESICYFLNENYKDSIKLFVICHTRNENKNQSDYWEVIRQVLDKWGIDYIDISQETDFCDINEEITTQYFMYNESKKMGDGIHPLEYANKKIYGPLVADKLNSLAQSRFTIEFAENNIELGTTETYFQMPVLTNYSDDVTLDWSSDNTDVAYVDENGNITARSVGTAIIRVTAEDGNTAQYKVCIKHMALDLSFDKKVLTLKKGDNYQLKLSSFTGITSYNKTFKSSDVSVASVTSDGGIITANNVGTAVISCKTSNGVKAECTVIVE